MNNDNESLKKDEGEVAGGSTNKPAADSKPAAAQKPLAEGAGSTQKMPLKGAKKEGIKKNPPLAEGAESTQKMPLKGRKKETQDKADKKKAPLVEGAESTQKIPPKGAKNVARKSDDAQPDPLMEAESGEVRPWALRKGPAIAIISALTFFVVVIAAYVFTLSPDQGVGDGSSALVSEELDPSEAMELKVFYPVMGKVALERRQVRKVIGVRNIATAAIREFLAGPADGQHSYVPRGVDVLGVYLGGDGILYMDFSSAMALNFQGDAVAEFLFLRALYRTLKENVYGVTGYRVLVDGAEVDTIGGHIFILHGLDKAVPYRLLEEDTVEQK